MCHWGDVYSFYSRKCLKYIDMSQEFKVLQNYLDDKGLCLKKTCTLLNCFEDGRDKLKVIQGIIDGNILIEPLYKIPITAGEVEKKAYDKLISRKDKLKVKINVIEDLGANPDMSEENRIVLFGGIADMTE
jgi:hypothetical protein